ncbi:M-phase inducer phosphatase 1-A-like [Liolophura sinensis]|uniref:M-phase inducer phosphatase 1-A-like n=1 Tax=Liolophura sinensis TaxID=3198878 RepID=UPI00315806C2
MDCKSHSDILINDESSRDSGVDMEGDILTELASPVCHRRMLFTDLDFSPAEAYQSPDSPLSFKPLRNLNFDMDSPVSKRVVSPIRYDCVELKVPGSFSSLFNGSVALDNEVDTPKSRRLATQLDSLQIRIRTNKKRASPSTDVNGCENTPTSKRPRANILRRRCQSMELDSSPQFSLGKSQSENEAAIMRALDRVSEDADLISDGSKTCCLPTIPGKHQDLKSITPETLAKVMNNEYDHVIENYVIVDCRYPYEFDGGHIKGAKNYYTRESIMENLVNKPIAGSDVIKRTVLIFHCEFSSERGPKMSRFLRAMDRDLNKDRYPELFYPEVYLLDGGYKNFFQTQKKCCHPQTYMPMHHGDYKEDLRKFRVKSKSWGGEKTSGVARTSHRRGLRF